MQINTYNRISFVGISDYETVRDTAKKIRVSYQQCKYPGKVPKAQTLEPVLLLDYLKTRLGEQFKWYILSLPPKKVKKLLEEANQNFRWELSIIRAKLFQQEHATSNPSQKRVLANQVTQIGQYIRQTLKVSPKPHQLHRLR